MPAKRLISIDIARAICIILVVIGHYLPDNSPNWYVALHDTIYTFHMPLFMFVSGYVYWATRKPLAYEGFIWKKFQRLMIPYFFASTVVIAIKLFSGKNLLVEHPVTYSAFYQMFYLPVAGAFLWFVFALFLIFLIVPFFNTRKLLSVLLLASLVLYFIPVPFPKIFCLAQFKMNLLYFVSGCAVCEWINIRQVFDKTHFFIALFVFAGMFLLKSSIDITVIEKILAICIALAGIVFISNLSRQIELKTVFTRKVLLKVSLCSYTIYLFHTTFEGFAKAVILKSNNFLPPPLAAVANTRSQLVFICIALTVILAGIITPVILHETIVRYSRLFSYLVGAKFIGKKN